MEINVFSDMTLCELVMSYRHLGGVPCHHLQGILLRLP